MEGIDQRITLLLNSMNSPWSDPFWVFMSQIKVWFPMYALVIALLIWKMGWKKGLIMVACIALAFFFNERVNNLLKDIVERVRPCNDPGMIAAGIHILETGGGWSFPSGHACNSFGFALSSALCLIWGLKGSNAGYPEKCSAGMTGDDCASITKENCGSAAMADGDCGSAAIVDGNNGSAGMAGGDVSEGPGRKCNGNSVWKTGYTVFIVTWAVLVGISRVMVARHFLGDVLVGAATGSAMGILWAWIAQKICHRLKL